GRPGREGEAPAEPWRKFGSVGASPSRLNFEIRTLWRSDMAEITATLVRQLREETNLPMMDCKQALTEAAGDKDKAKDILRKKGLKIQEGRGARETAFGRFGIYCGIDKKAGAIVEVKCESAPVA